MKSFEVPEMELVMIPLEVSTVDVSNGDPEQNPDNEIIWGEP